MKFSKSPLSLVLPLFAAVALANACGRANPTSPTPLPDAATANAPAPAPPSPTPSTPDCDPTKDCSSVVTQIYNQVNPPKTAAGSFEVTKRVAWALKAKNVGLLRKDGGDNVIQWQGINFSACRVAFPDGHIFKIMGDCGDGGANTPEWADNGSVDPSLYVAALDPSK